MYNIYLWLNLPQKLSQPVAFQRFSPSLPFLNKYKLPYPFLNFSPHLLHTISHWAMIMMRKDVSADDPMQILHLYREVLSWNNLGELQKLLPPSVSTFDIRLMDSKFRNFPPLLFHPPQQNRLAKNPAEQHATIWTRTEQNPPNVEIFCWRLS